MFRTILAAIVVIGAATICVAICAVFVYVALAVAYVFTSDPLDVWEDE